MDTFEFSECCSQLSRALADGEEWDEQGFAQARIVLTRLQSTELTDETTVLLGELLCRVFYWCSVYRIDPEQAALDFLRRQVRARPVEG